METVLSDAVIIFDLDGTLIDTAPDLSASLNYVLKQHGHYTIDPMDVRHLVGFGAKAMIRAAIEKLGDPPLSNAEEDAYLAMFLDYYHQHIADFSAPFSKMPETIATLRTRGAKIAVCTNKREKPARTLLEALALSSLFDCIVGSDTIGIAKPDPAPATLCCRQTQREKAVFIGDSDTDIRTAIAASMPCIIANFGYGPTELANRAFGQFDHFEKIPDLVTNALQ